MVSVFEEYFERGEQQMNPLIYQMKAELITAEKEKQELELKVSRLLCELQTYSNPFYSDYEQIKAEEIEQLGDELTVIKPRLIELKTKINKLKNELGA